MHDVNKKNEINKLWKITIIIIIIIIIQSCISDVKALATANMPKVNDNKTELMLVTSK